MSRFVLTVLLSVLLVSANQAEARERREIVFDGGLTLSFELPSDRWKVSREAPASLVKESIEHLAFHMAEDGREVPDDLEAKVRRRLGQNELFVYNPLSGSHLDIDLSAVSDPGYPPSDETVAKSAEYARAELMQEKDLTQVRTSSERTAIEGAASAYRIDATYLRDGEERTFVGIVGYGGGYWLFFYYTDTKSDPQDLDEFESLLTSLRLERAGG